MLGWYYSLPVIKQIWFMIIHAMLKKIEVSFKCIHPGEKNLSIFFMLRPETPQHGIGLVL